MNQQSNISYKYQMDKENMIRFQILVYCHMNGMLSGKDKVSPTDIDCLTLIGIRENGRLLDICKELVDYGVCGDVGYARNIISRMEDRKLVCKKATGGREKNNKIVYLNPVAKIHVPENQLFLMNIEYQPYAAS